VKLLRIFFVSKERKQHGANRNRTYLHYSKGGISYLLRRNDTYIQCGFKRCCPM